MLTRSGPTAHAARLLVFISCHFRRDRIRFLFEQVRGFAEFDVEMVEVVLCTNTSNRDEQNQIMRVLNPLLTTGISIRFEVFDTQSNPWYLPWEHKPLLKAALHDRSRSFTHFIYAENDIRFTFYNFCYFIKFRPLLEPYGLVPSFLRYEYNNDRNAVYLTDIVWRNEIGEEGVTLGGQRFVSPSNPYCAMYIVDRPLAEEYVDSKSFSEVTSKDVIGWPIADRSAMGMTFEDPPAGFRSRCVVPIDVATSLPGYPALVHHLADNYTHRKWTADDKFHFGHTEITEAFAFKHRALPPEPAP